MFTGNNLCLELDKCGLEPKLFTRKVLQMSECVSGSHLYGYFRVHLYSLLCECP